MPTSPMGRRGQRGDFPMKNYSIIRDGKDYVVRVGETNVLRTSSRRRAVRLIADAAKLLQRQPLQAVEAESTSIVPDLGAIRDAAEVP